MLIAKKPAVTEKDRVVILEDTGQADIAVVYDSDDQAIYAASPTQEYAIPRTDIQAVYVSSGGRIFVIGAEPSYVRETERLAALEKSIVLRQITMYEDPPAQDDRRPDIGRIMTWILIAVLVLGVIFK